MGVIMSIRFKRVKILILTIIIIILNTFYANASMTYVTNPRGDMIFFKGTEAECEVYMDYVRHFDMCGGGKEANGDYFLLTYDFLNSDRVRFELDKKLMTWIDGSKWPITYDGVITKAVLDSGIIEFTDDAIRLFCPEFAKTHSLVPEGVPNNFVELLNRARKISDERNGIDRAKANTEVKVNDAQELVEETTFSKFWKEKNGNWIINDNQGNLIVNAWLCDDAVTANGKNVWYLMDGKGNMISAGLVQDNTGNYYSLETNHNGYYGCLRYKSGIYDGIYLELEQSHNGAFAAIKNPEGIEQLKKLYGVTQINIDNSNIVYTSSFK